MHKWVLVAVYLLLQPLAGIAATALEIQGMLRDLGYQPGTVDGRWGAKSREALKHFQAAKALPATGKITSQTERALQDSLNAQAKQSTPNQDTPPLATTPDAAVAVPKPAPPTAKDVVVPPEATLSKSTATPPETLSHPHDQVAKVAGKVKPAANTAILDKSGVVSPLGMRFVQVPGGCFTMGGGQGDTEHPHMACVHKGSNFLIGQYEVTQGQWKAVTGHNPSVYARGASYPVESVSWNDVHDFIVKLNAQGHGRYRLPTEAEWEYSARAGTNTKYWWGDNQPACEPGQTNGANFNGGAKCPNATQAVGTYKPNPFGLYDVHGNVWEWVADMYLPDAYTHHKPLDPVITEGGTDRVFRGGSWLYPAEAMTVFHRDHAPPEFQFAHLGFRLIYEP